MYMFLFCFCVSSMNVNCRMLLIIKRARALFMDIMSEMNEKAKKVNLVANTTYIHTQ